MCWGVLESNHLIISTNQKRDPKRKRFFSSSFRSFFFSLPWRSFLEQKRAEPFRRERARVYETTRRARE
jgi:hypothetical protein